MIFDPHLTLRHTKICQIMQQKAKLIRFQGNHETLEKYGFSGYFKANRNYDKSTVCMPRQNRCQRR